jgi:hypothetical protein
MPIERVIRRNAFRPPGGVLTELLASLAEYQPVTAWPRDVRALADTLVEAEPFTILLFAELLAPEHWRRKTYTIMRAVELVSELDETVYRHFDRELNNRMADWLRNHRDPENAYLRKLVREYHPQARRILRAKYQDRYPRTWQQRWAEGGYLRPRRKVECRRRYDLPAPLGLWETDVPQQFFFMQRSRTYARGCSTSSGSREIQSYLGLALLELTRRGLRSPSYILVYDCDNCLRVADSLPFLGIIPAAMGSNCDEPVEAVRNLTRFAATVRVVEEDSGASIREIRVSAPERRGADRMR